VVLVGFQITMKFLVKSKQEKNSYEISYLILLLEGSKESVSLPCSNWEAVQVYTGV